ncbi:MAG: hypothetical protein AAB464_00240 [Patescibacteria group bacterium]
MIKSIQLKLSKIKYSGDSIGDDIRVEIEILGQFSHIDKIIKASTTAEINKEIGKFETDQKLFKAHLRITVIEKDLLFNDIGNADSDIEIDTNTAKSQQFVYKVQIRETRSILGKFWGKKTADFEIILEANIIDTVRYIPEGKDGKDGWLVVKIENHTPLESLPVYLKVKPEFIDSGREYFKILEGAYRNKSASIKLKDDGSSNLISGIQHEPMARALYSVSKKTFTLNGKTYTTVDYKNVPWEKGLYDIEIPDYPHKGGLRYSKIEKATTWFRIGHSGDRYLHTGRQSLGCITIIENNKWIEIYNALIKTRKGDFISVGILEVVN